MKTPNADAELLEAVKSCLVWMKFTIPQIRKHNHAHTLNWGGPMHKAVAAIAKAENKTEEAVHEEAERQIG